MFSYNETIIRGAGRNAQIEALIGRTDMYGLSWQLTAAAVDAMLEDGSDTHAGWNVAGAIEMGTHAVDVNELDAETEAEVTEAVQAAIDMLQRLATTPKGIVLANGNDGLVHAAEPTLDEAKAFLDRVNGQPLSWSESSSRVASVSPHPEGAIYRAVEIGLLDWEAGDGERVAALGTTVGYWLARDTVIRRAA
jgi:peptidoglycan/xylan/chitin deacetylase (PgdA/CDA1 family)